MSTAAGAEFFRTRNLRLREEMVNDPRTAAETNTDVCYQSKGIEDVRWNQ